jgi:formate--tetrahydrofolate ligase
LTNIRRFGVEPVVAINRFPKDTASGLKRLVRACEKVGVRCEISEVYRLGGKGGIDLAKAVDEVARENGRKFRPLYPLSWHLRRKIEAISMDIYGARRVYYSREASRNLDAFEELGFDHLPICMAKTQMSFTDNPKVRGAPEGFDITITDATLSAGAGFVVAVAGQVVTMPGLPTRPAAERVRVDARGNLLGMV